MTVISWFRHNGTPACWRRGCGPVLSIISFLLVHGGFAQTAWQGLPAGAGVFGRGGLGVVENYDLSSLYWNPAGLSYIRAQEGYLAFAPAYRIEAAGYSGFIPARGTLAINVAPVSDGPVSQVISAGWGKQFRSSLHLGLALHLLQFEHHDAAAFGLGMIFQPVSSASFASGTPFGIRSLLTDRFTFGAALQGLHFGGTEVETQAEAGCSFALLPTAVKLAFAGHFGGHVPSYHLGLIVQPFSSFQIYSGIADWRAVGTGAGLGWSWQNLHLDAAYRFKDRTLKITTSIDIGPPARELSARAYANAYAYLQDNRLQKALEYGRKSLEYDPQNLQSAEVLSNLMPQLHAEQQVIDSLMTAAEALIGKGWYISAATNYLKVLRLNPDHQGAAAHLEKIGPYVTEHTDKWFELAQQYFDKGDLEMARDVTENILLVRPDHQLARKFQAAIGDSLRARAREYYYAGLGYYQQQKFDEAEAQFAQALILEPDFKDASHYMNLISSERMRTSLTIDRLLIEARRLEKARDWQSAIQRYRQILSLSADHETAREKITELQDQINLQADRLFSRGEVAWTRGDRQSAKKIFRQVLELKPNHAGARNYLEEMLTTTERSQRFEDLARDYIDQGRWDAATGALDSLDRYRPNSSEARHLRQKVYANLSVEKLFNRCNQLSGDLRYRETLEGLQVLLSRYPNHQAGLALRKESQARLDRLVDECFNLGIKYYAEEDYRRAIVEWQKALQLNPSHRGSLEYKKKAEERLQVLSDMK